MKKITFGRTSSANTGKRLGAKKSIFSKWQLYLMLLPAVLYVILFNYKPMYGILMAFQDFSIRKGIWGSKWVGFYNFERLFDSYWFPIMLKNTLVISGLGLLTFPLPVILALMVNEIKNKKLKKTFQIVSYAPHFISVVVVCSMINLFLSPSSGIISLAIQALGFEAPNWLTSSTAFKWILTISGQWQGLGWGAIIYYATLSSVDPTLHEAAEIDGASRLQRIWHVNVPALLPTVAIMLILKCGQIMTVGYEKIYLLQNDLNIVGSEVISTYVYKMGLQQADFSFSTAVGLLNSVVNSVLLIMANRISKKLSGSGLL